MTHTIRTQDEDIILDPGTGSVRLKGDIFVNDVPLIIAGTEFGAISDSQPVTGTCTNSGGVAEITIAPGPSMNRFVVGSDVKVFGANAPSNDPAPAKAPTPSDVKYSGPTGTFNLSYKTALLDLFTGRIGACSDPSVVIATVTDATSWTETIRATLTVTRGNINQAVLVYRALKDLNLGAITDADYVFTYVWGPQQLGNNLQLAVQDFGAHDLTVWSEQQFSATNQYVNTVLHVPHVATTSRKGWYVGMITDVDIVNRKIKLDAALEFNTPATVTVYFDNTRAFQDAVNAASAAGSSVLQVKGGDYLLGAIRLPNGVTIQGSDASTRLIKQHWDTSAWASPSTQAYAGSLFYAQGVTQAPAVAASGITIKDMVIQGNKVHQIPYGLANGSNGAHALISVPGLSMQSRGTDNSVENVRITDCAVEAVHASYNNRFSLRDCLVSEGPRSYQYYTNPITVTNSTKSMVLDNQFEHWPGPVDMSANTKSVIDSNFVSDCGTGIRIYAVSASLTHNNYVLGPADEWIPTPDLKDSDFNSVNITVARGISFVGPQLLYVQDSQAVDLTDVTLRGRVYQLSGPPGTEYYGAEYEKSVGGDLIDITSTSQQKEGGVIAFGINAVSTQQLPVGQSAKGPYTVDTLSWDNTTKQLTVTFSVAANANQFVLGNSLRLQFNTTSPDINNQDWPIVAVNANTSVVIQLPNSTPSLTTANNGSAFATTGANLGYQITGERYTSYAVTGGVDGEIQAFVTLQTTVVVDPGEGYEPENTVKLTTAPYTTNDASITVTHTRLVKVTIANAGSGLTNGTRTFTIQDGTGTAATFTATVSGGVVTSIGTITNSGSYTGPNGNPSLTANAPSVDSGSTNATFNLVMGAHILNVTAGGAYDLAAMTNLATTTTTIDSTASGLTVTCTGGLANVFNIRDPGAFYHVAPKLEIKYRNGELSNATATCIVNANGQITTVTQTSAGTGFTASPIVSVIPYGAYYYTNSGVHYFVLSVDEAAYTNLTLQSEVQLRGLVLTNTNSPNSQILNQDLQVVDRDPIVSTITVQLPVAVYDAQLKSTVAGTINKKTNFIIARGMVGVI